MSVASFFFLMSSRTPTTQDSSHDPYTELILGRGMLCTQESMLAYFKSLEPEETWLLNHNKRIDGLILQCADPDRKQREKATQILLSFTVLPVQRLRTICEGNADLEIKLRIQYVLDAFTLISQNQDELTYAALQIVIRHKFKNMAANLLRICEKTEDAYVLQASRDALVITAQVEDSQLLEDALKNSGSLYARWGSMLALSRVAPETAKTALPALLKDPDERLKVETSRALINLGNNAALFALIELLHAKDVMVRTRALQTLKQSTGKSFGFVPYEEVDKRKPSFEKWKAWVEKNAAAVILKIPLRAARPFLNHTLICNWGKGTVIERDHTGKTIWKLNLKGAWHCQPLPNGHRLISSYNSKLVVEYDKKGEKVWSKTNLPGAVYYAQRLESGNTLVACYIYRKPGKIMEIKPDGSIGWSIELADSPICARRLKNGNTLICLYTGNKVIEVDQKGKEVWSLNNTNKPMMAIRLENGNTLVMEQGTHRVAEYDPKKNLVWSCAATGPVSAQRLKNGNTLIGTYRGIFEVTKAGKKVWSKQGSNFGSVLRH